MTLFSEGNESLGVHVINIFCGASTFAQLAVWCLCYNNISRKILIKFACWILVRNKNEEEQSLFAMWRGDMIHDGSAFQFIISRSTICLFAAGINIAKTSTKAQLC